MEICCLSVLEARSSKSVSLDSNQGICAPSGSLKGTSVSCHFQLLEPVSIPWLVDTLLQSLPVWLHCLLLFFCV